MLLRWKQKLLHAGVSGSDWQLDNGANTGRSVSAVSCRLLHHTFGRVAQIKAGEQDDGDSADVPAAGLHHHLQRHHPQLPITADFWTQTAGGMSLLPVGK